MVSLFHVVKLLLLVTLKMLYWLPQREPAIPWENTPWVKLHRYKQTHLYLKLNGYEDNEMGFKELGLLYFH